ncbi:putative pectinesterase 11 [Citrus sinensis]|nr:putative pectinesterase 11 [Citrus sinensis]KAH9656695.1 putative pectinesterase 11 [Citrus sinensis]
MGSVTMKNYSQNVSILVVATTIVFASITATCGSTATIPKDFSAAVLIRVEKYGRGDFRTIQGAIDSVPDNNSELVFISVAPGIYREKIIVPANKPFITISGTKASHTKITWSDGGSILDSATFTVLASHFVARSLTIQNTYGSYGKAVALRVSADRAAFYGCRILSYQHTLLDDTGNHYYSKCIIEGATDFISGNANSLFERCLIHSLSTRGGAITAQKRVSSEENTGFTFLDCKISGVGKAVLGRPWGPYSRVVYALTYMSDVILPQGWNDLNDHAKQKKSYYGEYRCSGPGADRSKRIAWSNSLSDVEASMFLSKDLTGGGAWLRNAALKFKDDFTINDANTKGNR